jgi:hypothetical protein
VAKKTKPYAATDENLLTHGLAPTLRYLIATALDGSTITYGQLATKLEEAAGFSRIFRTRMGFVVGSLMNRIHEVQPEAPLINVLAVNQEDRQPSKGAGPFMADRFGDSRLYLEDAKDRFPDLWEKSFRRAAGEVYRIAAVQWATLFEEVFNFPLNEETIEEDRRERKTGTERDGIPTGRNYGRGGEGPLHKSLRLWVRDNPQAIDDEFTDATTETEVDLDSGDRIDVVYKLLDRTVVVEVKSRISNDVDLRRGVYQCIKYRAVREAMDARNETAVHAILVTETEPPGEIIALLKFHGIRHFQAPIER